MAEKKFVDSVGASHLLDFITKRYDKKIDKIINNPTFNGAISFGRKIDSVVGENSIAIGDNVSATALNTFAEGENTIASGWRSHAAGTGTIASSGQSYVIGRYNAKEAPEYVKGQVYHRGDQILDEDRLYQCNLDHTATTDKPARGYWTHIVKNLFTIGNGNNENTRANAYNLDLHGNGQFKGSVYVGCNADSSGGEKVATEAFVTARIPNPPSEDGNYILQCSIENGNPTYSWILQ